MKTTKEILSTFSDKQLGEIYKATIGHNPFDDDENVSREQVLNILINYQEEDELKFPERIINERVDQLQNTLNAVMKLGHGGFVKHISIHENTGGNIMNDIIILKNGHIIRVSEDGVGIYEDEQKDEFGESSASVDFAEKHYM